MSHNNMTYNMTYSMTYNITHSIVLKQHETVFNVAVIIQNTLSIIIKKNTKNRFILNVGTIVRCNEQYW